MAGLSKDEKQAEGMIAGLPQAKPFTTKASSDQPHAQPVLFSILASDS
jgi:hypothetical protein